QYTAHPNINAVVTPNDDNANAVISVLQKNSIPANSFPTTGQDASTAGLQNILKGYQCGTVYKPVYAEAQAAAALAVYLRAGQTPPSTLVNSTTKDSVLNKNFGPVQALVGVDLDVPSGQVTALAGDNGAGKSVLIKCIAGIHSPESGQISWEGKPVSIRTPREAAGLGIETVYQDLALC